MLNANICMKVKSLLSLLFLNLIIILSLFSCSNEGEKKAEPLDPATLVKGDTIQPLAYINPDEHDWKVEIRISGEDLHDVSHKRMKLRQFWTSEEKILKEIREWKFIYGGEAVHKASSTLRVYRNNELIEKYGIILEKRTSGMQSIKLGFLRPVDPEEMFRTMEEMD